MTGIVIRRTEDSQYKLEVGGSVVKTYQQTTMTHPWDWAADAKSNGATEGDIQSRNYEYIDDR